MSSRRSFLQKTLGLGAGIFGAAPMLASTGKLPPATGSRADHQYTSGSPVPVVAPDVPDLPFTVDNGVKVFRLIAEPVKQELIPGKIVNLWGFNGGAPGPTIQVTRGDRVRLILENHLPEPTAMHWHGLEIPHDMDGGPGISQDPIRPGERFVYEFTLNQDGTFFYHSHMAMQEMMGMLGAFIIHPRNSYRPRVDKDFAILLQEYAVLPNNPTPNSMNMEFNWLTFNGKCGPATSPMIVRQGERVRIRMINLGMDHHPVHLHGNTFYVTGTEGGRQPEATWGPGNTVLVGVAQARDIEFDATNPGDWMLHCHLPHHMMNAMSSVVGRMTRDTGGMPAGAGMNEGMGIMTRGNATSEDKGPSLGRGMGAGASMDQPTTNGQLSPQQTHEGMNMQEMNMEADIAPNANSVPGFPQDAFMEGPMMAMDRMVDRPGNYGLRSGWSGFSQGMMSLVRVLPPDQYDKVMDQIKQRPNRPQNQMPGMEHHHDK